MNYPVFDGHCDTALKFFHRGIPTFGEHDAHVTLQGVKSLPRYAQFFAFCTVCYPCGLTPEQLFLRGHADFMRQLETHSDHFALCTDRGGLERAWRSGKCAAFLALEGAEAIGYGLLAGLLLLFAPELAPPRHRIRRNVLEAIPKILVGLPGKDIELLSDFVSAGDCRIAVPRPRLVMILPSATTGSYTTVAPSSLSSNPG